jgi:ParB-like chromosome segregation protein Spo0J
MNITTIELSALQIAPWNARKTFDSASLAELAESIKQLLTKGGKR